MSFNELEQLRRAAGVAALVLALGAFGCGGEEEEAETSTAPTSEETTGTPEAPEAAEEELPLPTIELDEGQTATAEELAGQARNASFPRDARTKEHAKVFLYLAATSEDPNVIAAALHAMADTFTANERYAERREMLGEDYVQIVMAHLSSDEGVVQAAAMEAAKQPILVEPPNQEIVDRLVELATSHETAAGRHEAMEVLWNSKTIRDSQEQMAPYVQALDAEEPWVVSGALFRLDSFGRNLEDQDAYRGKLKELLGHDDPGVRGRAADALASAVGSRDPQRDEMAQAIMPLLNDDNTFTKSAAAGALASMDYQPAIHEIVKLLGDMERNTYDIDGYTELDGGRGRTHHDGSAWSRVADAALNALKRFSGRVGERFDYDVNYQTVEEDLQSAAGTAREWYDSVKGEVPEPA